MLKCFFCVYSIVGEADTVLLTSYLLLITFQSPEGVF